MLSGFAPGGPLRVGRRGYIEVVKVFECRDLRGCSAACRGGAADAGGGLFALGKDALQRDRCMVGERWALEVPLNIVGALVRIPTLIQEKLLRAVIRVLEKYRDGCYRVAVLHISGAATARVLG